MDEQKFDRYTRRLARQRSTRRGFFGFIGGLAVGGLAAVGLGEHARWSRALAAADSEEQSVMLLEGLANIVHTHTGGCDELRDKVLDFQDDNRALLDQLSIEQVGWSDAQLANHADTYGDRRWDAVNKVVAASHRCQFSDSAPPFVAALGATPTATELPPVASRAANAPAALHAFSAFAQSDATCSTPVYYRCGQPSTHWTSTSWEGNAACTDPFNCTQCGYPDDYCEKTYPDICAPAGQADQCELELYFTTDSCVFPVQAVCWNATEQKSVPGSDFSAMAACDAEGNNCTLCDVPDSYCSDHFPDECASGMQCIAGVDMASSCTSPVMGRCLADASAPAPRWVSGTSWMLGNCESGPGQCTFCESDDICATNYPDQCVSEGVNHCSLSQYYDPPSSKCCDNNCPMSTSDCMGVVAGMASGRGYALCLTCVSTFCGSSSHCFDTCAKTDCCYSVCGGDSSAAGAAISGGQPVGTPVAVGTPVTPVLPEVTPTTTGTVAPPPTVALPTEPPPTAPPPTVALPTEPPPPPSTPGTPSSAQ